VRELVDPVSVGRGRVLRADAAAVPPRRLRARTGAPGIREFVDGGREAARELAGALESAGRSVEEVSSVLDFGSGSGRVLPHIARLASTARCTGSDVDPSAIEWARGHHPEYRWAVGRFDPPLPFAGESFDLVYSISVFSHLDELRQDRWLSEIERVLAPGGLALLSVHGAQAFEQFRTRRVRTGWCPKSAFERRPLGEGEFVFVPYRRSFWIEAELPGIEGEYGLAFHDRTYVISHWSPVIEVLDVLERAMTSWQDIVVCRKPEP
jgi:SAM-dependent methyltransferase